MVDADCYHPRWIHPYNSTDGGCRLLSPQVDPPLQLHRLLMQTVITPGGPTATTPQIVDADCYHPRWTHPYNSTDCGCRLLSPQVDPPLQLHRLWMQTVITPGGYTPTTPHILDADCYHPRWIHPRWIHPYNSTYCGCRLLSPQVDPPLQLHRWWMQTVITPGGPTPTTPQMVDADCYHPRWIHPYNSTDGGSRLLSPQVDPPLQMLICTLSLLLYQIDRHYKKHFRCCLRCFKYTEYLSVTMTLKQDVQIVELKNLPIKTMLRRLKLLIGKPWGQQLDDLINHF